MKLALRQRTTLADRLQAVSVGGPIRMMRERVGATLLTATKHPSDRESCSNARDVATARPVVVIGC